MELYKIYKPITATPFKYNDSYMEFEPCEALKPYIRCFWGSKRPYKQIKTDSAIQEIVTPDTCVDIIFDVDFTNNQIYSGFCGIDDQTFVTYDRYDEEKIVSTFAIRFYAWSAILFSEDAMSNTKNGYFEVDCYFSKLKKEIQPLLFDVPNIEGRIQVAESYLLKNIHIERTNPVLMNAIAQLLLKKGNMEIGTLSKEIHISNRQMERIFKENIGISPKKLSSLIRYQYLWKDILFQPQFHVQDLVGKYGYTDQAHLLNDFKRFHSMNINEARERARKDVVFLQEK